MPFETKAIFTLADFLKQLEANEYYDIAQKFYTEWLEERLGTKKKLTKVIDIYSKFTNTKITRAFYEWKAFS